MCRSVPTPRCLSFLMLILLAAAGCDRTQDMTNEATVDDQATSSQDTASVKGGVVARDRAASGKLAVGDAAPPVTVAAWLKGDPIDGFQKGQVHVVEFWATWCPPCRTSMPHISQLQEHFGDQVLFVGISDEDEQKVCSFLDSEQDPQAGLTWDEVVKYRIAIDPQRVTYAAYMQAAGQTGIPTAFVVGREGHIEWIGHPMAMDAPLESIVAGTWDRKGAKNEFAERHAAQEASVAVSSAFRQAQQSGDWGPAIDAIDKLLADFPGQVQFRILKFQALLRAERIAEALTLADELANEHSEEGQTLNQIAWALITEVPPAQQDLELTLKIAEQASFVQDHKDGATLDTLARVYYEQGNLEQAVTWQRKAAERAPDQQAIRKTLEQYEAESRADNGQAADTQ